MYPDAEQGGSGRLHGVFVENLRIPAGGVTAVIGGSGSGKSTLLGLLAGLRPANRVDEGSRIDYRDGTGALYDLLDGRRPPPGEMAFVFQESQLIKTIPARMNAELGARVAAVPDARRSVDALAQDLGVADQMDRLSETLSGGQAQRIAVIRALCVHPRLIVCDEPTSSLDEETGATVMHGLHKWALATGCAVLWVTHNLEQAARFADGVVLVAHGRVYCDRESGQPWPVFEDPLETLHMLRDLDAQGRRQRPLTEGWIDAVFDAAPDVAPGPGVAGHGATGALSALSSYAFIIRCAVAEVSAPFRRALARGWSWYGASAAGMGGTLMRSLTQVLFLGLLVFYSVALGRAVTEASLSQSLAEPQMSHFTMAALRNSGSDLDRGTLLRVDETLQASAGDEGKIAEVFGRREQPIQYFWFPEETEDGTCATYAVGEPYSKRLQVFDNSEPLFADVMARKADGGGERFPLAALEAGGLVVTGAFMEDFGLEVLDELCLDLFGPVSVPVVAQVDSLPGGGERSYALGLTEQAYLDIFIAQDPAAYKQENRLIAPEYSRAAVYFQPDAAEKVICAFEGVPGCDAGGAALTGFKVDAGVLEQIRGLQGTLSGAQLAFGALAIAFAATIAISTGLSVGAFVRQNEKSIAVMKAFGYGFGHVLVLILTQIAILLGLGVLLFMLAAQVFQVAGVAYLAEAFDLPQAWLAFQPGLFLRALVVLVGISLMVTVQVLAAWWLRNAYLGETLQAI